MGKLELTLLSYHQNFILLLASSDEDPINLTITCPGQSPMPLYSTTLHPNSITDESKQPEATEENTTVGENNNSSDEKGETNGNETSRTNREAIEFFLFRI